MNRKAPIPAGRPARERLDGGAGGDELGRRQVMGDVADEVAYQRGVGQPDQVARLAAAESGQMGLFGKRENRQHSPLVPQAGTGAGSRSRHGAACS